MIDGLLSALLFGCLLAVAAALPFLALFVHFNRRRIADRAAASAFIRSLETQSTDGVVMADAAGSIQTMNPALLRMFGYTEEELRGRPLSAILPSVISPRTSPKSADGLGVAVEGRRKDGTHFPSEMVLSEVAVGVESAYRFFLRDLTQHQLADSLFQELRFASGVVEYDGTAIVIVDQAGQLVRANRAFYKMVECAADEVKGRYFWEILLAPEAWPGAKARLEQLIASNAQDTIETLWRAADGNPHRVSVSATVLPNPQGAAKYAILAAREIDEALPPPAEDGEPAAERLAAGMASRFNELLTVVNGYAALLLHSMEEKEPLRRDVEHIKEAGERAAGLTGQLLAYSGRQPFRPQIVQLNEVINDRKESLRLLLGDRIQLSTALDPELGWLRVDMGWLEQGLLQLVTNGRDAMPDGGRLTIETINVLLREADRAAAVPSGDYVVLAVSDTGAGLSEQDRARMFEPFSKGYKTAGVGLAGLHTGVRRIGGGITVESSVEKGNTIRVLLPRLMQPEQPVQNAVTKALHLVKGAAAGAGSP